MSKFPVPVSGEKIPHGWFANLVRFVNSLTLRGDGRYTMVSRNESGTTVTLTPAVKNAIERSGGTPPGSGGETGFPIYSSGSFVVVNTSYPVTSASWLIGSVGASLYEICSATWSIELTNTASGTPIADFRLARLDSNIPTTASNLATYLPICIPIPAGVTFNIALSTNLASGYIDTRLYLYPAL